MMCAVSDLPVPLGDRRPVGHLFAADRRGRCTSCGLHRGQHAAAEKEAIAVTHNENIARYGGRAQTDMWEIPDHGGDPDESIWWAIKDQALPVVALDRRERGCDCEAPPWFSPPGEWPMKILLAHDPGCSTIRTPERETVLPLGSEPSFPPYPARDAIEPPSTATGWPPSPPAIQSRAGREGFATGGIVQGAIPTIVGEGGCTLTFPADSGFTITTDAGTRTVPADRIHLLEATLEQPLEREEGQS